jgi:hypothetical protein
MCHQVRLAVASRHLRMAYSYQELLRQNFLDVPPVHVGQPPVATIEIVDQFLLVESEQVQ